MSDISDTINGLANESQSKFLEAYCDTVQVAEAARVAGVDRRTHYKWLRADDLYAAAYEACRKSIEYHLTDSLADRLTHGWEEPVFHNGEEVGTKRKFDNATSLKFLGKLNPEKFGDKVEVGVDLPEKVTNAEVLAAMRGMTESKEGSNGPG